MTTITINTNNLTQQFNFNVKGETVFPESLASPNSTEYSEQAEHEYNELTQEIIAEEACELNDWTEKRDKVLKNLASKCKYDWKKIAKKFNTNEKTDFTPLQLKQKYKDLTKVSIPLRVKFSHQEDLMIAKYFEIYGCDWAQISTFFTDRTAMMLKNRYYSHIRKRNLLSSMLDEVKEESTETQSTEVETETESVSVVEQQENIIIAEEADDDDCYKFFFERADGIAFRKFSNNIFDLENAIPNELFDKITFSYN